MRKVCLFITLIFWAVCSQSFADVGYYSPGGISDIFSKRVDMATINAIKGLEHIRRQFEIANKDGLKINLDLGPVITKSRPIDQINMIYTGADGVQKTKIFSPAIDNKIRAFKSDKDIRSLLTKYLLSIKEYKDSLYSVFLVDEPYLNGVSKEELERVGRIVRGVLDDLDFKDTKIGVLFAGAMFNSDFAKRSEEASFSYTEKIDDNYKVRNAKILTLPEAQREQAKRELEIWVDKIKRGRLTTYDASGNMFTGGGIPYGYDIVAFDFYTSTFLFDGTYEDAISWLTHRTAIPQCEGFHRLKASKFRTALSFFQDGPLSAADEVRDNDRNILDKLYDCRIGATTMLLKEEISRLDGLKPEIMLVSESSSNGFLEFSSDGVVENSQPEMLVRKRVAEEVDRAIRFYRNHKSDITHLLFFTFHDAFDDAINLKIGGIASMPEIQVIISGASNRNNRK